MQSNHFLVSILNSINPIKWINILNHTFLFLFGKQIGIYRVVKLKKMLKFLNVEYVHLPSYWKMSEIILSNVEFELPNFTLFYWKYLSFAIHLICHSSHSLYAQMGGCPALPPIPPSMKPLIECFKQSSTVRHYSWHTYITRNKWLPHFHFIALTGNC